MNEAFIIVVWVAGLALIVTLIGGLVALGLALYEMGRRRMQVRRLYGLRKDS